MLRRVAGVLVLSAAWVSCVGDDPGPATNAPATGDHLGPCFPDQRCKEGLVCDVADMVCITPGEMRDGGASPETGSPPETGETGSSQDATGETGASSDASTDDDASQSPDGSCALTSAPKPGPFCGSTQCPTGIWCCYSAAGGGPQCSNICPEPAPKFVCDGPRSCPNGGLCCITLQATASPASACTEKTGVVGSDCVTSSACPNSQVRSCVVGSDCGANGVCVPTEIELPNGQGVAVWGVCAPNDGGS